MKRRVSATDVSNITLKMLRASVNTRQRFTVRIGHCNYLHIYNIKADDGGEQAYVTFGNVVAPVERTMIVLKMFFGPVQGIKEFSHSFFIRFLGSTQVSTCARDFVLVVFTWQIQSGTRHC